jgi:enamine deaminase RidA (YjgF/YER057c/UK114 family)
MRVKNPFLVTVLAFLVIALIAPIVMAQPKGTTGKIEIIQPEGLWDPRPRFAQVVKVGNQVYIAGQTSVDEKGNLVGKGDIEAQARQVFKNLQKCLEAVGARFDRVVKLNIYALNLDAHREAIGKVRNEFLVNKPVAITSVQVSRLVNIDWLLEIEAIAVLE